MARQRWLLGFAISWLLFINHYSRDISGALEKEIEAGFHVSNKEYSAMNSAYFVPNLLLPVIMGTVSQSIGALPTLVITIAVSAVGHLIVGVAASSNSFPTLFFGRVWLGLTYETIDMLPLPMLAPIFGDVWAFMVGIFNAFLRLGSVLNFVASPWLYHHFGLAGAFWASSILGLSGLPAVAYVCALQRRQSPACAVGGTGVSLVETSSEAVEETSSPVSPRPGVRSLPLQYWLYLCVGICMYGAIVPFWFFGSRYLQEHFRCSLEFSDALMLLPEGMIALLGPIVGAIVDKQGWSLRRKLLALAASLLAFPAAFGLLLMRGVPPLLSMILLGSGWAFSNNLFWTCSAQVVPAELLSLGSGILGTSLNLGATAVPWVMARLPDEGSLLLLICVSTTAALAALVTACWIKPEG